MRQLGGDRGLAGAGDAIQQMWKQMGIDPTDSGVMAMLQNQMKQMFGAQTLRRGWRCRPTSPVRPWRPRPTRR